ncbi:MAG: M67 family metallopeptidase [Acidobacteriota bacterium]|nr:M67 family metallopeptidase [Acidobacteriota bacterium]
MLILKEEHIAEIKKHGERDYPRECGGLLVGHLAADGAKTVVELMPMENAREESARHNRVLILPKDLMRAERYAREKKLDVVGYYHSHPDHPAVPSQFDLDHALPVWSYIIVSVQAEKATDLFAWQMENDRSKFNREEMKTEKV